MIFYVWNSFHSSESYLSKLISNGYRVAVCEQINEIENDVKNKGPMKRKVGGS